MKIDYDKIADVLYIAIKDRPGIADEVSSGNFIRYGAGDGEIMGITVLDFNERFMDFKKRFTGPPVAENPFRTAVLEVQNGILDPPDTGNLPPCDVPGRACVGCEFKPCPME